MVYTFTYHLIQTYRCGLRTLMKRCNIDANVPKRSKNLKVGGKSDTANPNLFVRHFNPDQSPACSQHPTAYPSDLDVLDQQGRLQDLAG